VALLATFSIAVAAEHAAHGHDANPPAPAAPLLDGLGATHHPITTKSPMTQKYFDQGLRLIFAFNHDEAQRSFEHAASLDPDCAMCWWGVALSLGPHVNLPALPDRTVAAYQAAEKARARVAKASAEEKALIAAIEKRYSDPAPATPELQKKLDTDYANAMREVSKKYADDLDVATLFAESLMDLEPWDYWTPDLEPRPETVEVLATLESVLKRAPGHPGAAHYYIHTVEAGPNPEKALDAAKRLQTAMPGAGHLVHMPSHIYLRLGRYAEASEWNRKAIVADDAYQAKGTPQAFYMMYVAHNHQFLMASCMFEGRSAEAIKETNLALEKIPVDMLRQMPGFDLVLGYPVWTRARFGRWNELLDQPAPPADFRFAKAAWHAARSLAYASTDRLAQAEVERDSVTAIAVTIPADMVEGLNTAQSLLEVATNLASGTIAIKRGDPTSGLRMLEAAVTAEDKLRYDEPSDWYFPTRHVLGAALLTAGKAAEAEAVYRRDLEKHPENGWALSGLAASLSAEKKSTEAAEATARRDRAWKNADTKIVASWW
jgi:tetratricopeptide (TPR) repeat protein